MVKKSNIPSIRSSRNRSSSVKISTPEFKRKLRKFEVGEDYEMADQMPA